MIRAPILTDNLAARVSAILLGSFILAALAVVAVMLWPRPEDPGAGLFALPAPTEAAAIVEALEHTPPAARPYLLRALNTSVVSVRLQPDFPPIPPGLVHAPALESLFKRYTAALQDRPFRVDLRRGLLPSLVILKSFRVGVSVQMSIRLANGQVLVIERRPPGVVRSYIARAAATAALVGLVILAALAVAVRQTARPVNQLALAARAFSLDGETPDLPTRGPREIRELSAAFNDLQHRIRSLVEERTRVLGAVAHDLRTYLTRLRLRTEFIADEDQRRRAERDVEEMSQLLDDILLFSEQAARPPVPCAPLDLPAALAELVAVRAEMGEPVSLAEPPHTLVAACPALTFRRMAGNLIDNALRYGGAARVSVHLAGARAEVRVDDDGPGIPPEALQRLLLPFERLETSRARATGGAGLGLAIVKGLADSCQAELRLENRSEGGLRAVLSFPLASAAIAPAKTPF